MAGIVLYAIIGSFMVHNTGTFYSIFIFILVVMLLMAGICGSYANFLTGGLMVIMFLLFQPFENTLFITPWSLAFIIGGLVLPVVSYLFWRRLYIQSDDSAVSPFRSSSSNKLEHSMALIEIISDGVVIISPEGDITDMNPAARRMSGWSEDAKGLDPALVFHFVDDKGVELPEAENPFKQVMQSGEPIKGNVLIMQPDNSASSVSVVINAVTDQDETVIGAVAVLRDVTDDRAEEARRADFVSTASHEMRTPVAAIEGYLALALNDRVSKIDSKARDYLEKAHSSTQHLGNLFQDLLTSAKAEDGRLVNHPIVVDMGAYLEQLTDSLRFSAQKKGLLLDFILGAADALHDEHVIKPLYYTCVDPDRLAEVITNLFDNAVKYTPSGKITVGLTGNEEVVQLYIKDTGPGISPDDLPHLFQKFYRVDNSDTRTIGGTGLGLFICKKIIEIYKGRIWVTSVVDEGSTFYINLPRLSTTKARELQQAAAAQPFGTV